MEALVESIHRPRVHQHRAQPLSVGRESVRKSVFFPFRQSFSAAIFSIRRSGSLKREEKAPSTISQNVY